MKEIPFGIRFLVFGILSTLVGLHHRWLTHSRFEECPKTECPPLSIVDNCNSWRYPERSYMESLQKLHREVFLFLVIFLIPDWAMAIQQGLLDIQQYFENRNQPETYRESYRKLSDEEIEGTPTFSLIQETQI